MPDKRSHRGPGPKDGELFGTQHVKPLQDAVADLNWLLSRDYAERSSLKLVGDRYRLTERQRKAIMRCACSNRQRHQRQKSEVCAEDLPNKTVVIDGYNLLITVEAALSNAVLLKGSDGCIRDLAGIHGTYRRVEETLPAIKRIASGLRQLKVSDAVWLLDKPVSNSGRLKALIDRWGAEHNISWQVILAANPDKMLIQSDHIVISSDSGVLDRCSKWFNFVTYMFSELDTDKKKLWLIELSG